MYIRNKIYLFCTYEFGESPSQKYFSSLTIFYGMLIITL